MQNKLMLTQSYWPVAVASRNAMTCKILMCVMYTTNL